MERSHASTKRFLEIIGLAGVVLLSLSAQTIFAKDLTLTVLKPGHLVHIPMRFWCSGFR